MSVILDGKEVARAMKEKIKKEVAILNEKGVMPCMGIIRVGNRVDDISYENGITKNCNLVGIETKIFECDDKISMQDFINLVNTVNDDKKIHGILIFRPLPKQIDSEVIKKIINPMKDIDCMNPENLERVFEGDVDGFVPCTPKAVMEILKYYKIPLEGANAAVINRSMVVGKPLAMMLLKEGATVTICHSKTKDLPKVTSSADIVIAAVGRAKYIGENYFSKGAVAIDVGINNDENLKLCGDIDYEKVSTKVGFITPVPGGVGSVTSTILLENVLTACKKLLLI